VPDPSASQSATAGDQSRIIQVHGDNNIIGVSPSLKLIRPLRERPAQTSASADEAALLVYHEEATAFVGHKKLLDEFITWATTTDPGHPVSVRVLTGGAGTGKTRFAMELCRALEQRQGASWQAGFVRDREASRFLSQTNLSDWGWQAPTLAVFDYAMTLTDVLPGWMEELAEVQDSPRPLRILLLERHADPEAGWLKQVFPGGYSLTGRMLDGHPVYLPGLSDPDIQIGIMQAMLKRLGSTVTLPADAPAFRDHLAQTDWAGAPLYLMMAAMVINRQGDVGQVLSLRRTDLAKTVAEHECSRLTRASNGNPSLQRFLSHMAALATLCGGLDGGTLLECIRQEKKALGHEALGNDAVAHTLKQLLPDCKDGVAPILPDIVGEAFLFMYLGHGQTQASTEAVLRAFPKTPAMVAAVLIRCVQDFAPATLSPEDAARAVEQKLAVAWLHAVVGHEDIPLQMLMVLSNAMPEHTLALRELGMMLAERLVVDLRKLPERNMEQQVAFFISLNNLALRRSALGQRKEALETALEALILARALSKDHPETCFPNLAMILNNLSQFYFDIGQREEALAAAQEATDLYRNLVRTNPKAFISSLAKSLHNLANRLPELGEYDDALVAAQESVNIFHELTNSNKYVYCHDLACSLNIFSCSLAHLGFLHEALKSAQEAVIINSTLANINQEAFLPNLASSLINLSNRFSNLGQGTNALSAAQEAVTIRRALVLDHPEAFGPNLAMSLENLANRLSELGQDEIALSTAEEAVGIYRAMAQANPKAFRPNLAGCLNSLANKLFKLEQYERALATAQEAITIRRALVLNRPEVFLPDLADSLNNLVPIFFNCDRREEAVVAAQEAVNIRRVLSQKHPKVFLPSLAASLNNLAAILAEIGQREDALAVAHEAAEIFYVLARQYPQAYGMKFMIAMLTWLSLHHGISREDADTLFRKNPDAHVRALFEGFDTFDHPTT